MRVGRDFKRWCLSSACALAAPVLLLGSTAARAEVADAAPAEESVLEEITVTAQKRAENLQDTPIAITAVTGATLEAKGRGDIAELGQMTPNLVFNTTAPVSGVSSGAVVFIRGIGQTDFQLTTDPGVGTYIDGVYVARSIGGVLDVLDLERVEVLRGPQGTLFGRNTIGGAISLVTREPTADFQGRATVTGGSFNRADVRISLSGPVSDDIRVSLVASSKNRDGYVRGLLDNRDLGDVNRDSARATILFQPTSTFKALLTLDGTRIREQNAANKLVGVTLTAPGAPTRLDYRFNRSTRGVDAETVAIPPGNPSIAFLYNLVDAPVLGTAPYDGRWITPDLNRTYATGPNGTRLNIWGGALTLEQALPLDATIKSITAYRSTNGSFNRDPDGSPLKVIENQNFNYDQKQFSQELQLTGDAIDNRLKYVGGVYYFRETGNDFLDVTLPIAFGSLTNYTLVKNKSYAAYGQLNFAITDTLGVTGGVRYTEDKKQYRVPVGTGGITNGLLGLFGPPGTMTPFIPSGTFDKSFNNTSFKAGVDWKPNTDTLIYLSYSEGFKSGGFNTRYLVPVPAIISYDPELLTTYELGVKWEGFDRRLRVNGSTFHSKYRDIQLTVYEQGAPITRNGGSARINGAELEFTALPVERLTLSGGLGYLDAKYTQVPTPIATKPLDQQITRDKELAKTPKWTLNARAEYRIPVSSSGELRLAADWMYSSHVQNDAINSKFLYQKAFSIANASIGYWVNDGQWSLTAFVDNLTNRRIIESGDSNYSIGFHEANFNRPREYGLTLATRF